MASSQATAKPGEKIWDWEVIKALYMGGMELKQIVQVPRFKELSLSYLGKRASEQKWRASREEARAEGTGQIARSLISKMAQAEEIHQAWLLDTLEEERKCFDKETIKQLSGGKNQLERLKIIDSLDVSARRQLGLDDRKPVSTQQKNLGILISMQSGGHKSSMKISVAALNEPNGEVRASRGELEAAEIIQSFQAEEQEEPAPKVLPPGIKPLSPFKVKGGEEPLVNEKDIVEVINASGEFTAVEIQPGTDNGQ